MSEEAAAHAKLLDPYKKNKNKKNPIKKVFKEFLKKGSRIEKQKNSDNKKELYRLIKLIPSIRVPRKKTVLFTRIEKEEEDCEFLKKYLDLVKNVNEPYSRRTKIVLSKLNLEERTITRIVQFEKRGKDLAK
jgi:bacterioferritin (cytochrome b1)